MVSVRAKSQGRPYRFVARTEKAGLALFPHCSPLSDEAKRQLLRGERNCKPSCFSRVAEDPLITSITISTTADERPMGLLTFVAGITASSSDGCVTQGMRGAGYDAGVSYFVSSVDLCRVQCLSVADCAYFSYSPGTDPRLK